MPEETAPTKTLWMLECENGYSRELIPMYALSEKEANQLADEHIRASERPLTRVGLHAFPGGFTIYRSSLPGKV